MIPDVRAVVDGRPAGGADVALALAARAGHFTALQVRGRAARGLDLHLARLTGATAELYGERLDPALVLNCLDLVLGDDLRDASVRLHVVLTDTLHVLAVTGAPVEPATGPLALRSVPFQRFLPHIKHGGGFPQAHLARRAAAEGFDEVLLTAGDGVIAEGGITNLGALSGGTVVWPEAPMLHGVTMALLERALEAAGVPQERRVMKAADLAGFDAVFVANSHGVAPAGRIDDVRLATGHPSMGRLRALFDAVPWDPIRRGV
ncbi:aminotransferase class IV [Nonomuraea sp. NBC_01738]|uniref:aminotransferase class IV n=1 Tax=Nonomuraea sp. NBC_01738 TaxID=2976003 RepID=UPI002E120B68|nr:aminotransferase class IV [Nonomuraea sp. NBC_01738]